MRELLCPGPVLRFKGPCAKSEQRIKGGNWVGSGLIGSGLKWVDP